jgi:hypothetical protein
VSASDGAPLGIRGGRLGCSALLDLDVQYVDAGPDSGLSAPDAAGDDHATDGTPDATAFATDAPAHQENE